MLSNSETPHCMSELQDSGVELHFDDSYASTTNPLHVLLTIYSIVMSVFYVLY